MTSKLPRLRLAVPAFVLLSFFLNEEVQASRYRIGATMGLGGTGIQAIKDISTDPNEEVLTTVKRANAPGALSVYVERSFTSRFTLSLEHFRGFKLSPFSSGVHFTGGVARYFFTAPAQAAPSSNSVTTIHIKRLSLYAGLSSGVAIGKIESPGDLVPEVDSSGVYFGGRIGSDFSFSPEFGLRSEIVYGFTFISGGNNPSNMQQFGIMLGAFLFL